MDQGPIYNALVDDSDVPDSGMENSLTMKERAVSSKAPKDMIAVTTNNDGDVNFERVKEQVQTAFKSIATRAHDFVTDEKVHEQVRSVASRAQDFVRDEKVHDRVRGTMQTVATKTQDFLKDERVQELSARAAEFARDVAGQIFTKVDEKLKSKGGESNKANRK
jgi:hypothetical protein